VEAKRAAENTSRAVVALGGCSHPSALGVRKPLVSRTGTSLSVCAGGDEDAPPRAKSSRRKSHRSEAEVPSIRGAAASAGHPNALHTKQRTEPSDESNASGDAR
jgi:hypothetical protein